MPNSINDFNTKTTTLIDRAPVATAPGTTARLTSEHTADCPNCGAARAKSATTSKGVEQTCEAGHTWLLKGRV